MAKPLIVVFGATGLQGGSVVRFLAKSNKFELRGITRNPNSPKAQALKKQLPEIELVSANLNDPESVFSAIQRAYGVYGVTDFWEHGYDTEVRHGKTLIDAAKKAGVKHFIWSAFDHSELKVPHFESKAEVDGFILFGAESQNLDYLKQSGVPRTSLYTAFYIENIREAMKPIKTGENSYTLPMTILPDAKSFLYPVDDTGAWVTAAFNDPNTWIGKDMRLVTEWLSTREMAAIASRVSGKAILPMELDEEAFQATKYTGNPLDEELWKSKLFAVQNPPESGIRDQEMTLRIYPQATTYEQFIQKYKDELFT